MKYFLSVLSLFIITAVVAQDNRGYDVKVGDMAPDFEILYQNGTKKKLSSLRGKVVMLQFTASWCSVCIKEMPHIESDIWQKYKNRNDFALLGVGYKEPKEKLNELQSKTKITYPLTLDQSGEIFHKYAEKGAGVTRNVIVDKTGKIIFLTRLFDTDEFEQMKNVISKELNKK